MILKVWDNGGKTCDRYTVRIRNDYFGMSDNPRHPQGFNQYVGSYPDIKEGRNLGRIVREYRTLPDEVKAAIYERGW